MSDLPTSFSAKHQGSEQLNVGRILHELRRDVRRDMANTLHNQYLAYWSAPGLATMDNQRTVDEGAMYPSCSAALNPLYDHCSQLIDGLLAEAIATPGIIVRPLQQNTFAHSFVQLGETLGIY